MDLKMPDGNPVWLKGPSRTGKTTLLYEIKNQAEHNQQSGDTADKRTVKLVSCDQFVRDLISIFQWDVYEDVTEDFIERYCGQDIIMIDDVDYTLEGKNSTQLEMFHVIQSLIKKHHKQVILTCHELPEPLYGWLQESLEDLTIVDMGC